jgi:hypothetical protein
MQTFQYRMKDWSVMNLNLIHIDASYGRLRRYALLVGRLKIGGQ